MLQLKGILKPRGMLPTLAGVSAVIVGVGALGQTSQVMQSTLHNPGYPAAYDNSKADIALRAYDESHPSCALWSDWHKLCSRTGPNGSTYCRTDPEHPTKPSAPFCGRYLTNESDELKNITKPELISRERFSRILPELKTNKLYSSRSIIYDPNRPFNGTTISELYHPDCLSWFDKGGENCDKKNSNNFLSCHLNLQVYKRFICKRWSDRNHCNDLKSGGVLDLPDEDDFARFDRKFPKDGSVSSNESENIPSISPMYQLNRSPVWGIYCGI